MTKFPFAESLRSISDAVGSATTEERVDYYAQEIIPLLPDVMARAARLGRVSVDYADDLGPSRVLAAAGPLVPDVVLLVATYLKSYGYKVDDRSPTRIYWGTHGE